MTFTQKKELTDTEKRNELHRLNALYTDCLAKEFTPAFLSGKNVRIEDFCQDSAVPMFALDK